MMLKKIARLGMGPPAYADIRTDASIVLSDSKIEIAGYQFIDVDLSGAKQWVYTYSPVQDLPLYLFPDHSHGSPILTKNMKPIKTLIDCITDRMNRDTIAGSHWRLDEVVIRYEAPSTYPRGAGALHEDNTALRALVPLTEVSTLVAIDQSMIPAPVDRVLIMAGQALEKVRKDVFPVLHCAPRVLLKSSRYLLVADYQVKGS
jgi:hypothetical protein